MIEHNQQLVRTKIKEQVFSALRGELKQVFQNMIEKDLIKEEDPLLLANEFMAPIILLRLEYLLLDCETKKADTNQAEKFIEQHINFFWQNVKK